MKIQFIKNAMGIKLAYFEGDVADFPEGQAKELIKLKYAKVFEPGLNADTAVNDLPEDLPARAKLIKAGFPTLKSIEGIHDFTGITGIGKALAKQIKEYLER